MIQRHPIRLATLQVYLFGRALRRLEKDATAELQARGIARNHRVPVLDQLEWELDHSLKEDPS